MFDLELTWDRPAQLSSQQPHHSDNNHVLRVRIIPQTDGNLPSLPLRMTIALDISQSMTGEKLQSAKDACLAVVSHLRDIDHLSLAGYSTTVTPLLQSLPGGDGAVTSAQNTIAELQAGGVTSMDLALDWIEKNLPPEESTPLVGILITDGHATNNRGVPLDDVTPLIDKAQKTRNHGITLYAVGLGTSANFNTSFLSDLSDKGGGTFIYADTPDKLSSQLQNRLKADQEIAIVDAKLRLTLSTGVKPTGYCRLRPEYLPQEKTGENELSLGTLRRDCPTDILIALDIPPIGFGERQGSRDIISVELTACGLQTPIAKTAAITYTSSYREAQKVNTEVNRDRRYWDINLYSKEVIDIEDSNPKRTAELLTNIQVEATQAGETDMANQAAQQLDDLKKTGKLNPDNATGMLTRSRNLPNQNTY
jgi:Ca-activated chloride channel homolog